MSDISVQSRTQRIVVDPFSSSVAVINAGPPGPPGPSGPPGVPAFALLVAASDASSDDKGRAMHVCDGTDDQVQIQAALDALPAWGGRVELTSGTFNISAPIRIEEDSTALVGTTPGQRAGATQIGVGTKLNAVLGLTDQLIKVQRVANDRPVYGTFLQDFVIEGNDIGTAVDGILLRSNRCYVTHVHVHQMTGHGIRLQGYAAGAPANWDTYDSHINFCQLGDNGLAGVFFDHDSPDCHLVSSIFYNNQDSVIITSASEQITSCHFYNAQRYNIFFDGGGSRTKILGCKIEGAGQHAINIDSTNGGYSDIQIIGNGLSTNGDSALNTYDHIIVQGPSSNGVTRTCIVGNSFGNKNTVSSNLARYGVNLNSSAAQSSLIVGNTFGPADQFGTATVRDNGSTTSPALIKSNLNVPDSPPPIFVNVKDSPYLARGNGSVDDAPAIQAALDALPETGGVVYLPPGEYEIGTTLTIKRDNTTIIGAGAGNRIGLTQDGRGSRIAAGPTLTGALIRTQRVANDRTVYGVKLQDLVLDGDSVAGGIIGLHWRSVRGTVSNVAIYNCTGPGVQVEGYTSWQANTNRFVGCSITNCSTSAIYLKAQAENNLILGCELASNQDGILIEQPGNSIADCHIHSNTRYGINFNSAGSRTRVTGTRFRNNGRHGVIFDSTTTGFSDISMVGCSFDTNGVETANTYDHIILTGPSGNGISRIAITGCNFSYTASFNANKPRYAVNLSGSAAQSTVVSGCTFGPASHWGTGALNNNANTTNVPSIIGNTGVVNDATRRLIKPDLTTAYVPIITDENMMITLSNAAAITVTLPSNGTVPFPIGAEIDFLQLGTGQPTFVAGSGATVNGTPGLKLRAQYSACTAKKVSASGWVILGDLSA